MTRLSMSACDAKPIEFNICQYPSSNRISADFDASTEMTTRDAIYLWRMVGQNPTLVTTGSKNYALRKMSRRVVLE